MTGRPRNARKADAIARGLATYTGSPCRACLGVERYTSDSGCVACRKGFVAESRGSTTPVIIRIDSQGDAVAFFPETRAGEWLDSYPQGRASLAFMRECTKPITIADTLAADTLAAELERIGYKIRRVSRLTPQRESH